MACLCFGIKRILLKYHEILQRPSRLQTNVMEEKLKILKTNPKSDEIANFYLISFI